MPFNISSYIDCLRQSLDSAPARVAFAVWYADEPFRGVREYLATKTIPAEAFGNEKPLTAFGSLLQANILADDEIRRLQEACAAIDWGEESVTSDEELVNAFAIEAIGSLCCALETCSTGSAVNAAKAAESVSNALAA